MMERIMNYVKPELIVVAVVLYFIGTGLKQSQTVKDKYRAGDRNGGIHGDYTGNFNSWIEYICESDH